MSAPLTPEAWHGEAAALVITLAGIEEPVVPYTVNYRYCVLCDGQARTEFGPVQHDSSCVWKRARWLSDEARR